MKWVNVAVFKLAVFLIIGILIGRQEWLPLPWSLALCLTCLLLLIASWLITKRHIFQKIYFGIWVYLCFSLTGNSIYQLHQPKYHPDHYSHRIDSTENFVFQLNIRSLLKSDSFSEKYTAQIIALNGKKVSGEILLSIAKDSIPLTFDVDDVILIRSSVQSIYTPKNPHGFDYARYMREQGVYHQLQIRHEDILVKTSGRKTLAGASHQLRKFLSQKLEEYNFSSEHIAIINALILGQKRDIPTEIYAQYSAAGVVHILSVSGLHVGILLLILQYLLKPLDTFFRKGKIIKTICIVLLLWLFAILAGLSPSVLRAVTMFSFVAVAINLNRYTSTFNALTASAILLLIINPNLLFSVGFQLSYLAVCGILFLYPKLFALYKPRSFFDKLIWANICVSTSAQIGVLPLTLYLFHQFPGLYILGNLLIVPFCGILLAGGIVILLLASFNTLPHWLAQGYSWTLEHLNIVVAQIARQESFFLENIPFSFCQMLIAYFVLLCLIVFLQKRTYRNLVFVLGAIIGFQGITFFEKYQKESVSQLVVFHKSRHPILGIKLGKDLHIYSDMEESEIKNLRFYRDYLIHERISSTSFSEKLPNVLDFGEQRIWIIDSLLPKISGKKPDIVIFGKSPKINLERFADSITPRIFVADGSNYKSYVEKWKETAMKKKLPFHYTAEKGAFILTKK